MRFARTVLSFLIFFFLSLSLKAQQAPATNAQAVAHLQKTWSQLNGPRAISDVTLTGTARRIAGSDDETGTVTLKALASGASRLELSLPSGRHYEVRNASAASQEGAWSGPDGVSHKIAFHNLLGEPAWFFPAHAISRALSAPGQVATHVGHETKDSIAVEHLALSQKKSGSSQADTLIEHLSQVDIYLDSSTHLPAAMTFNMHPDNDSLLDIPIEIRFSDYRLVSGAQIPFHIQKFLNNGLVLDLQFQSAVINSGLSSADFVVAGLQTGSSPASSSPYGLQSFLGVTP